MASAMLSMLSYKKKIESQKEHAFVFFDTSIVHTPERRMRIKAQQKAVINKHAARCSPLAHSLNLMATITQKCHNKTIRTLMMKYKKYYL